MFCNPKVLMEGKKSCLVISKVFEWVSDLFAL